MHGEDLIRFVWSGCSWGKFFVGLGGAEFLQSAASRPIGEWGALCDDTEGVAYREI